MFSLLRHFYLILLLLPIRQGCNRFRQVRLEDLVKNGVLFLFALGVAWAEYAFFARFWMLLGSVPFGYAVLLPRFFSLFGSFLIGFLTYSSVLTALSSLFQSEDLPFLLSMPVRLSLIIFSKGIEVAVRSGATLFFIALPPMISLGMTLDLSYTFYSGYLLAVLAFTSIGVCVGIWIAMAMVAVFPVKRMHQTVAILGLCLAALAITGLRFLHVETLWSEKALSNPLILFLQQTPSSWGSYAPGQLFASAITPFFTIDGSYLGFWVVLGFGVFSVAVTSILGQRLFIRGWWKNQEQGDPEVPSSARWGSQSFSMRPSSPMKTLFWKDWLIFKRDPSIWTQLFMMFPLAALYLLNLSFLPLKVDELVPFYAVADVGLVGMMIAALGARFLFPTASREGRAVWIPVRSPVRSTKIIWQKAIFSIPPVLVVAIVLLVGSARILQLSSAWLIWTLCYGGLLSLLLCSLALFLGFCYPSYHFRHLLEVSLGKGSFLFMIVALAQIASLMVLTVHRIFHNPQTPLSLLDSGCITWALVWIGVTYAAYWRGRRRWDTFEDNRF